MSEKQVLYQNTSLPTVVISVINTPLIIRLFLSVVALIIFVMPIVVTGYIVSTDGVLPFGLFISYFIAWLVGAYLTRIVLWNTYGKEELTLYTDKISYRTDFKFFQSNKKEITVENLQLASICIDEEEQCGILGMTNGADELQTVIKVPMKELIELDAFITSYYA